MSETAAIITPPTPVRAASRTVLPILAAVSLCHLLNDLIQSLLPAIYPILKANYALTYSQIGLITLTFFATASVLQPIVGAVSDRRPLPFSLPVGMGLSLLGLLFLSVANSYPALLLAAALIGVGSSVFHPESSRVARMASGGRHGFAQSFFQVGGNTGSAIGPLLAALVVVPHGQGSVAWFAIAALLGIAILTRVGFWYRARRRTSLSSKVTTTTTTAVLPATRVRRSLAILVALTFSKYVYLSSLTNYFTFYLIQKFSLSVQQAQVHLFIFLGAVAAGTFLGGPIGDRIGRRSVIWVSILGVLPFTLTLPYVNLFWTTTLSVLIGFVIASAFSAIIVYAQELVPGRVGTIAGLFFGFAFGLGGLGAAVLGLLIDREGLTYVYRVCAFLPALGMLTALLPRISTMDEARYR